MLRQRRDGVVAPILWEQAEAVPAARLLVFLDPSIDPRNAGYHVIQSKVAIGSGGLFGKGFTLGSQKRLAVSAGAAHRLHLLRGRRGARVHRRHHRAGALSCAVPARHARRDARQRCVPEPGRVRPRVGVAGARHRERRHDAEPDAGHRHPAAVLQLRRRRSCSSAGSPWRCCCGSRPRGGAFPTPSGSSGAPSTGGRQLRLLFGVDPNGRLCYAQGLATAGPIFDLSPPMAWFRKEKKPRQPRRERLEIPPDTWEKCEACGHTDIRDKFLRNFNVCPECDYHRRLRAWDYAIDAARRRHASARSAANSARSIRWGSRTIRRAQAGARQRRRHATRS